MIGIKRYGWDGKESSTGDLVKISDCEKISEMADATWAYMIASRDNKLAAISAENEILRQMIRDANKNQNFDFVSAIGAEK